jgi:hypothetical protein
MSDKLSDYGSATVCNSAQVHALPSRSTPLADARRACFGTKRSQVNRHIDHKRPLLGRWFDHANHLVGRVCHVATL